MLDTKEQSVSQKVTLSALKFCSKWVWAEILSECAIKNELKEVYSIVWKEQKLKLNSPMETTSTRQETNFGPDIETLTLKHWRN